MTATDLATLGQPIIEDAEPQDGDLRLWAAHTILDQIDKPALQYWTARETARAAIRDETVWKALLEREGEAEAVKWLAGARYRPARNEMQAKDLGSAFHMAVQNVTLDPDHARPDRDTLVAIVRSVPSGLHLSDPGVASEVALLERMLDRFDEWCARFAIVWEAAEVVVYNVTYGYAGTLDLIVTIDGVRFLIDIKTTREPYDAKGKPKTPYGETVLQLAGYRFCEFAAVWAPRRWNYNSRRYYLLSPAERALAVPVPAVEMAGCLYVTPERCELHPCDADDRAYAAFLHVLEVARWTLQDVRGRVGKPIVAPSRETEE